MKKLKLNYEFDLNVIFSVFILSFWFYIFDFSSVHRKCFIMVLILVEHKNPN